jgi:hypothetical protein
MGEAEFAALGQRIGRLKTAIALGQPDRVPVAPFFDGIINRFTGRTYKDVFYDYERAGQSAIEFVQRYPNVDAASVPTFTSGLANELAGTRMIDWPGRPGTSVADTSTHQINEIVFMEPEEYPELLRDYTGFMLRKFLPRAFTNLQGTANVRFDSATMMNTGMLGGLTSKEFLQTAELLAKIGEENNKAAQALMKYSGIMAGLGYPGMITGIGEAPYDILGDYFRGTMGIFEDLLDEDVVPYVEQTVEMFTEMQIARLQFMRYIDLPFKSVFFPLHKGMDGFMSDKQYEKLYWEPLKRIILALIDMDVLPYIYTEGPYDTRLDYLTDVPAGKVLYHFEKVDMKRAKEKLGKIACISGNLSISNMEFGKPQQIIDETKYLLDTCAPGGGYIFDFNGSLENAKPENMDAMFETLEKYGKY